MSHPVTLSRQEALYTAVIQSQSPVPARELARFVPAACGEVWSWFRSNHLPKPGRNIALYSDQGMVEAGAEVAEPFTGSDRVRCSQLPAGLVAGTVHFGPYGGLGEAHEAVRRWCDENGHLRAGRCWEIYGHWEESWNDDPSCIRTDIFHLLKD